MDDLAYNKYVTTAWLDAYYHGKWWSAVELVSFPMSGCIDRGYHRGKRIIGHLQLLMRHSTGMLRQYYPFYREYY